MAKYLAWLMIAIGLFLKLAQVLRNRSKHTCQSGSNPNTDPDEPREEDEVANDKDKDKDKPLTPGRVRAEHSPIIVQSAAGMTLKCSGPGCDWTYDDPFGAGAQKSFDDHIQVKATPFPLKKANDPVYERRMVSWVNSQYQEPEA